MREPPFRRWRGFAVLAVLAFLTYGDLQRWEFDKERGGWALSSFPLGQDYGEGAEGHLPPKILVAGDSPPVSRPARVAAVGPLAAAPNALTTFTGLTDANTFIPPDTMGAVGPNELIVVTNTEVRGLTNTGGTGGVMARMNLNTFWA